MSQSKANKADLEDILGAPVNLPTGVIDYEVEYNKYKNKFEEISDDNFSLREQNSALRSELNTKTKLDDLIAPYAKNAFKFMCSYAVGVAGFIILDGFKILGFDLPDSVLNFLVGSTAVTVFGLVGMVLTGVFIGARKSHRN